jgi:hypothetical protein
MPELKLDEEAREIELSRKTTRNKSKELTDFKWNSTVLQNKEKPTFTKNSKSPFKTVTIK